MSTRIVSRPSAGAPLGEQLRRMAARRFPYAVIYRVSREGVEILAVAHQRRGPGYWRDRA